MFEFAGLFSRPTPESIHGELQTEGHGGMPVDYVVLKNGHPFARLNATPVLAEQTVAGLRRATPAARWTYKRC